VLWGDGDVSTMGGTAVLVGGADVFVFRSGHGQDRVEDFRRGDGDVIELSRTGLCWATSTRTATAC
jgi:Ca2+-binding RTX toxin-like protein